MTRTLRVGAAFPDPPFNGVTGIDGLDISMMRAVGDLLGMAVEFVPYEGRDFNGIFDRLNAGDYDCVTAGTTVTPQRELWAAFCAAYLVSGQSMAVDVTRHPGVRSIDDLAALTIGVQEGNTSQPIAERFVAEGKARAVRYTTTAASRTRSPI